MHEQSSANRLADKQLTRTATAERKSKDTTHLLQTTGVFHGKEKGPNGGNRQSLREPTSNEFLLFIIPRNRVIRVIEKTKFIIRHISGYFINERYEKAKDEASATRWNSEEEAEYFFRESHYKADKPEEYEVWELNITYELGVRVDVGQAVSEEAC